MSNKGLLLIMCGVLGGACASDNHAEQVRDARMAHAEEQADQREDAVGERASERADAIEQQYDARREAVDARNAPGSDQQETLLDKSQERAEYQSRAQAQLDKLGVRLQAAQQKISVLADRAPTKLRTNLTTAAKEHNTLQQELVSLRSDPSQSWESEKNRIEDRMSQLESRIGQLSDDIDDVKS
ncbi:MAG: hypothetical protein ABW321_34030 [Polyangiales bacterium]